MDAPRFDAWIRALGNATARRTTRRGLAALALAVPLAHLGMEDAAARTKRRRRRKRRRKRRERRQPCGHVCKNGCRFSRIQEAIDAATEGDTLRLCAGSYNETLNITRNVTLIGAGGGKNGSILSGPVDGNVVEVANGVTVTLERLHITNANNGGRGIYNRGTLTLTDSTISENVGDDGGGVYNVGTLTLIDSSVTDNAATDFGGGIYNTGRLELNGCSVTDNATGFDGGGIFNEASGVVTLTDSTVTDNTAFISGGGVYNDGGSVTLSGTSSVADNYPGDCEGVAGCGG